MKKIQFKNSTIDLTKLLPPVAVMTLFTVFSLRNPQFLSLYNIGNILDFANTYFIAGIGLTFVILLGSIDLSVGAMISLDTILFIIMINAIGFWAYPIIIVIGIVLGLFNGVVLVRLKIPSFIVTLGFLGNIYEFGINFFWSGTYWVSTKTTSHFIFSYGSNRAIYAESFFRTDFIYCLSSCSK